MPVPTPAPYCPDPSLIPAVPEVTRLAPEKTQAERDQEWEAERAEGWQEEERRRSGIPLVTEAEGRAAFELAYNGGVDANGKRVFGADPQQRQFIDACTAGGEVIQGVAAAGSGKTFSVVLGIASAYYKGVIRPTEIVGTTFTNKASREMQERLCRYIPKTVVFSQMRIGTFHSKRVSGQGLRNARINLPPEKKIKDLSSILRQILGRMPKNGTPFVENVHGVKYRDLADDLGGLAKGAKAYSDLISNKFEPWGMNSPDEVRSYLASVTNPEALDRGERERYDNIVAAKKLSANEQTFPAFAGIWGDALRVKEARKEYTFNDMLAIYLKVATRDRAKLLIVDECFPGDTPILLADGTTMPIRDIVEGGVSVDVLSYDLKTGQQVVRAVVGKKKVLLQQPLVRIVARRRVARPLAKYPWAKMWEKRILVMTADHRVIRWNGQEVSARSVQPGDLLHFESEAPAVSAYQSKHKHSMAGKQKLGAGLVERQEGIQAHHRAEEAAGRRTKRKLRERGGNGQGLTVPQEALLTALGADWVPDYAIPTGADRERDGIPYCYKVDLAQPDCRIAIEVDGESHRALDRREQDEKKDRVLREKGWRVYRFKNVDAVRRAAEIAREISTGCPMPIEVVSVEPYTIKDYHVYDLSIEGTNLYYANGFLVHNCQDNSWVQMQIVLRIAQASGGTLLMVGDGRQCIPMGQRVLTPHGYEPIEKIKAGDFVMSSCGSAGLIKQVVTRTSRTQKEKSYEFDVMAPGGTQTTFRATAEHELFAAIDRPEGAYVYLMYREGYGFRIGCTESTGTLNSRSMIIRCQQEAAEKMWILAALPTVYEAIRLETTLAYHFQVLMVSFKPRPGTAFEDAATTQALFNEFGANGLQLLRHFGQDFDRPPYQAKSSQSGRVSVNLVVSCDDHSEVTVEASAYLIPQEVQKKFNFRPTKNGCVRIRRQGSSATDMRRLAKDILSSIPNARLVETLSMADADRRVFVVAASGVHPGMVVPVVENAVVVLGRVTARREVPVSWCHDLEISRTLNYIVEGVVVHNSIYAFRGADATIFQFAQQDYNANRREIGTNYRSGYWIVEAGNEVCRDSVTGKPYPWAIGEPAVTGRRNADGTPVQGLVSVQHYNPLTKTVGEPLVPAQLWETEEDADARRAQKKKGGKGNKTVRIAGEIPTGREIAAHIDEAIRGGRKAEDFAILTRTNAALGPFELALSRFRIPVVYAGSRINFMSRAPITRMLRLLALCAPGVVEDPEMAARMLGAVLRDDGGVWYGKRFKFMSNANFFGAVRQNWSRGILSTIEALGRTKDARGKENWRGGAEDIAADLAPLVQDADWPEAASLAANILSEWEKLQEDEEDDVLKEPDGDEEDSFYQSLADIGATFDSYAEFMAYVAKARQAQTKGEDDDTVEGGSCVLSTAYKAKGLQWPVVYVLAPKEIWPHFRAISQKDLAEERRVYYVAITRAADELHVWSTGEGASPFTIEVFNKRIFPRMEQARIEAERAKRLAEVEIRDLDGGVWGVYRNGVRLALHGRLNFASYDEAAQAYLTPHVEVEGDEAPFARQTRIFLDWLAVRAPDVASRLLANPHHIQLLESLLADTAVSQVLGWSTLASLFPEHPGDVEILAPDGKCIGYLLRSRDGAPATFHGYLELRAPFADYALHAIPDDVDPSVYGTRFEDLSASLLAARYAYSTLLPEDRTALGTAVPAEVPLLLDMPLIDFGPTAAEIIQAQNEVVEVAVEPTPAPIEMTLPAPSAVPIPEAANPRAAIRRVLPLSVPDEHGWDLLVINTAGLVLMALPIGCYREFPVLERAVIRHTVREDKKEKSVTIFQAVAGPVRQGRVRAELQKIAGGEPDFKFDSFDLRSLGQDTLDDGLRAFLASPGIESKDRTFWEVCLGRPLKLDIGRLVSDQGYPMRRLGPGEWNDLGNRLTESGWFTINQTNRGTLINWVMPKLQRLYGEGVWGS